MLKERGTVKEHIASHIAGLAEKELLKWNNNTLLTEKELKEFVVLFGKSLKEYQDNNKDAFSAVE